MHVQLRSHIAGSTVRAAAAALESLESRKLLSNDPLTVGTYKVGTATWLNIVGTVNDDAIVIQRTATTSYLITNGTWTLARTGTFAGVRVLAGAGADSVATAGTLNFTLNINGEAGNDTLTGGNLNDVLIGGADDDSLTGGAGNDSMTGSDGNDVVNGGVGNDTLLGGLNDDQLNGAEGIDVLKGEAGADTLSGGAGNDNLNGGTEADSLDGAEGNDSLAGDIGADVLAGGAGNDLLGGGAEADDLDGGDGNDTLNGDAGDDTLAGGTGNDSLNGGANDDTVDGDAGNDKVIGDLGNDLYSGGDDSDTFDYTGRLTGLTITLDGQANDGASGETDNIGDDFEYVVGGNAADNITGNASVNFLYGGLGADTIDAGDGNDKVFGGGGNDSLLGGAGDDSVYGQTENDQLFGNDGEDLLEGGAGYDSLDGGDGRDRLIAIGGGTADSLTGGNALDSFWLDSNLTETISDISSDETAARAMHRVGAFVKYGTTVISKELTGQKLAEPVKHARLTTSNTKLVNYASYKLFADAGPAQDDINQGQAGDCWFLSSIAGVAKMDPEIIRQSITDLGDGTYAVRFVSPVGTHAEQYVRVDADLYTYSWTSSTPTYATLGAENSTWVALMEKAFTWVRYGGGTLGRYQTIDGGWMSSAYAALGLTNRAPGWGNAYANGNDAIDFIKAELDAGHTVTMGTKSSVSYNMVGGHAYTIDHLIDNGDGTYNVVLRNPWGVDNNSSTDGANDGYVTLTPTQLFATYSGLAAA